MCRWQVIFTQSNPCNLSSVNPSYRTFSLFPLLFLAWSSHKYTNTRTGSQISRNCHCDWDQTCNIHTSRRGMMFTLSVVFAHIQLSLRSAGGSREERCTLTSLLGSLFPTTHLLFKECIEWVVDVTPVPQATLKARVSQTPSYFVSSMRLSVGLHKRFCMVQLDMKLFVLCAKLMLILLKLTFGGRLTNQKTK